MSVIKKNIIFFFLIIIVGCGYKPVAGTNKVDFYIGEINFDGDRYVNNNISNNLKTYKKANDNLKNYKLLISTKYTKTISSKDRKGNPKNYNLNIKLKVEVIKNIETKISKTFDRSILMSANDSKIKERDSEKIYKKNLSKLLSDDIIFFLITK